MFKHLLQQGEEERGQKCGVTQAPFWTFRSRWTSSGDVMKAALSGEMCWGLTGGAEVLGAGQSPDKRGPNDTPALEGQPQRTTPEMGEGQPGKRI